MNQRTTHTRLKPLADRGPLRVMFLVTSMPVGGAETLLVNLMRRLDPAEFQPELCCLKELGPLGEELAREFPTHKRMLSGKYDLRVWPRLVSLMSWRRVDAVVTVGAGDKMFWGRLAAWRAGVPVVISALHSTGWPDSIGRLNRLLTPLTDAFVGVAAAHGRHLVEQEHFPASKVHVIPNGVDVQRFTPRPDARTRIRAELGISPDAPVCGIVAALRPEKNHELFLEVARRVVAEVPRAQFLIVGDGPRRADLEAMAGQWDHDGAVHFLGTRSDVPEILSALDLFLLTSHNEASPVSILEAMAVELPVVATRVGSIAESVHEGQTGLLADPGDADGLTRHVIELLTRPDLRRQWGAAARQYVCQNASLETMVHGYEDLIRSIYTAKCGTGSSLKIDSDEKTPPPLATVEIEP